MKTLAAYIARGIERQIQSGIWKHYTVYENELLRIWPLDQKDRGAKIAQFAKEFGFSLAFYKEGLFAIFTPDEK